MNLLTEQPLMKINTGSLKDLKVEDKGKRKTDTFISPC